MKRADDLTAIVADALMEAAANPRLSAQAVAALVRLAKNERRAARSAPKSRATTKKEG